MNIFTWTFMFITAFHNWSDISIWTFITPVESCLIYCSGKCPIASPTRQRTILNDPRIPCTMDYEINSSVKGHLLQCQNLNEETLSYFRKLPTWAFLVHAFYVFCIFSITGSSIGFFHKLNSCIRSGTRSTISSVFKFRLGIARADCPIIPYTMDC